MAKDRAKDPKRVPNFTEPKSHVTPLEGTPYHMPRQTKDGWTGETIYKSALTGEYATAKEHEIRANDGAVKANMENMKARREGKVPVVKIDSNPAKGK